MISHAIDLTGKQFSRLTVLEQTETRDGNAFWLVKCACGAQKPVSGVGLRSGSIKSCGCLRRERAKQKPSLELTGKRFGRLIVLERLGNRRGGGVRWLCQCDCGKKHEVTGSNLTHGCRSCGCLALEIRKRSKGATASGSLYHSYEYRAARCNLTMDLNREQFASLIAQNCHYCGAQPRLKVSRRACFQEFLWNGLDRKDNMQGYTVSNVVPCCKTCNWAKGKLSYDDFIAYLERVRAFRSCV
jgi:hypothetical protein